MELSAITQEKTLHRQHKTDSMSIYRLNHAGHHRPHLTDIVYVHNELQDMAITH